LAQVAFAGAATIATLTLSSAALSGNAGTVVAAPASGGGGSSKVMTVDDNNNPSSGDIFTQNAQDQSTANGAGT
jgi:hypothetical protein